MAWSNTYGDFETRRSPDNLLIIDYRRELGYGNDDYVFHFSLGENHISHRVRLGYDHAIREDYVEPLIRAVCARFISVSIRDPRYFLEEVRYTLVSAMERGIPPEIPIHQIGTGPRNYIPGRATQTFNFEAEPMSMGFYEPKKSKWDERVERMKA